MNVFAHGLCWPNYEAPWITSRRQECFGFLLLQATLPSVSFCYFPRSWAPRGGECFFVHERKNKWSHVTNSTWRHSRDDLPFKNRIAARFSGQACRSWPPLATLARYSPGKRIPASAKPIAAIIREKPGIWRRESFFCFASRWTEPSVWPTRATIKEKNTPRVVVVTQQSCPFGLAALGRGLRHTVSRRTYFCANFLSTRGARGQAHFFQKLPSCLLRLFTFAFCADPIQQVYIYYPPVVEVNQSYHVIADVGTKDGLPGLTAYMGNVTYIWSSDDVTVSVEEVLWRVHVAAILTCLFCSRRLKSENSISFRCTFFDKLNSFQPIMAAIRPRIPPGPPKEGPSFGKARDLHMHVTCKARDCTWLAYER